MNETFYDYDVTCHVEGCENAEHVIRVTAAGETPLVICGPCATPIDDFVLAEVLEERQAELDAFNAEQQATVEEAFAIEASKESARAKLAALGLTTEEVFALLG